MRILQDLCSLPTAPFAEHFITRYAEQFAEKRKLKLSRDAFGNLLLEVPGTDDRRVSNAKSPLQPRMIFTAHMDHPGFVARQMLDATTLEARFHGWVLPDFFEGARVQFFSDPDDPEASVRATVLNFDLDEDRKVPRTVRLRVARHAVIRAGAPGMWDQGIGRVNGNRFLSRVCDDLAGAAAALTMLDQLSRRPARATVGVLLTRAEEEGFIGAIAASVRPRLLRKSDRLIAIETSAQQPFAPQGKGAIVRIGDRTSVFNSALSFFLSEQAAILAKRDKSFAWQRALMPGGTCEATVYDVYGFTAASICVALGNYHNMDASKKRIAPEYIDLNDWQSMATLFIHIARTAHEFRPGHAVLKSRLERRFEQFKTLLQ